MIGCRRMVPIAKFGVVSCRASSPTFQFSQSQSQWTGTKDQDLRYKRMEIYKQVVLACNRSNERHAEFLPLAVDDTVLGYIHPIFAEKLEEFDAVFCFNNRRVSLHTNLKAPLQRTNAVKEVLEILRSRGLFPGWRDEMYSVVSQFGSPAHFCIERAAVPFFGMKAYGIHVNASVTIDGEKHMWVAERSLTKHTYPGYYDQLVAGGQPSGLTCKENVIKECDEEAGIPESLARLAFPVGAVSYKDIHKEEYKRDVIFCYDLQLPLDFTPYNKDGEVQSFSLKSIPEVISNLKYYKPNCALVVVDFLFRHGHIIPEDLGYFQLLASLRNL